MNPHNPTTKRKKDEIVLQHVPTGELFVVVKRKPITLVPKNTLRPFGQTRRPTDITLNRDYIRVS